MSRSISIADAVVSKLASASLSQAFTVRRGYSPERELKNLADDGVLILVVPGGEDSQLFNRGKRQTDYTTQVAVCKKIELLNTEEHEDDTFDFTEVDGLMDLVEEVDAFLFKNHISVAPTAKNLRTRIETQFDEEMYDQGIFASMIETVHRSTY